MNQRHLVGSLLTLLLVAMIGPRVEADATDLASRGATIYRAKCASCHGAAGEGSKQYAKPLIGEKSVGQLTRLIDQTMPEDEPETCVGEDASAVSAYIHEAFYSRTAQERNRPARVELSRLTIKQYRNTLADLVGSFRPRVTWPGGTGLNGQYYKSRQIGRKDDLVFARVDPEVEFDFGVDAPQAEGFDKAQFSIVWRGSILVPDSMDYEFVVRSDQAIRLFVNNLKTPLIDAAVASAEHTEQVGSIYLLGGRAYPISLEFSKAKQGVDDSKDKKKKVVDKHAGVQLAWRPAGQPEQVILARSLTPEVVAESFVPTTPFPPDDRSVGYERGSTVSKAWDAAVTEAAIEVSAYVADHLRELTHVKEDDADRTAKLQKFCQQFASRAFRRPLDPAQVERYVDRPFTESKTVEIAVRRSVLSVVKSPFTLYREVGNPDSYGVASRIAYGLWDAPPDETLLDAARDGKLKTHEQIVAQAERMLTDVRSKAKVRDFFLQWLKVDQFPDLAKDPATFPDFNPALVADLRASLELFLDDLIWGPAPDFRRLLSADQIYLNGRLAQFYGHDLPADAPFQKVTWQPADRSGVLTHPYLLAHFAYTGTSSPIHRGVFLMRSVLGRSLRPPPEAVAPLAPDLHASLSTRERVALQTSPKACINCHSMINPLGFGLENFDAVGRFREREKDRPVDSSGSYEAPEGAVRPYRGARELGAILAASPEAHSAFVNQLFQHTVKQPIHAFGPQTRPDLTAFFASNEYDIRKLIVAIVARAATLPEPGPTAATSPKPNYRWPSHPFIPET